MSGNTGKVGASKHAKGLFMALALGLMLACGSAYAAEPSSPAPATTTQDAPKPAPTTLNADASPAVGDLVFDGGIAFLIIVMAAFLAIGFMEKKNKGEE